MPHMINFHNLTQIQNNQSLMEEVENEDIKKLLSTFTEDNRKSARPRFLSGR